MEFIKFLNENDPGETLYILAMSILYGVASGLFAPLVLMAAIAIIDGKAYIMWLCLLAGGVLLQLTSYWVAESKTMYLANQVLERLVLGLADNLRREELHDFEQRNHSEIHMIVREAGDISEGAIHSIRLFQSMITVFVLWIYIYSLSNAAGLIFLFIYGLMILIFEVFKQLNIDQFIKIAQTENRLFDIFQNFLYGFKEIKTDYLKNNDLFTNFLVPIIHRIRNLRYHLSFFSSDFGICINGAIFFLIGTIVFILPSPGSSRQIMMLIVCIFFIVKPSVIALTSFPRIGQGQAALFRLRKFFSDTTKYQEFGESIYDPENDLAENFDIMSLRDVNFSYMEPDGSPGFSIGPLNMNLSAGEILFIAGGNGSGKSTLVKVLTGLYLPTKGTITVNNEVVSQSDYRYLFTAIFSDFHLFDALYGVENPSEDRIKNLLTQMQLDGKTSFSDGRFTNLNLSAGQRRRLAMVSVLLENRQIFVFDEWAADQDPIFRRYFYEELLPSLKKQGKTVVVVTHDDRFYHNADRIIILKDGKIVDENLTDSKVRSEAVKIGTFGKSSFFHEQSTPNESDCVFKKDCAGNTMDGQKSGPKDISYDKRIIPDIHQLMPFFRKLGFFIILNGICSISLMGVIFRVAGQYPDSSEMRWFFLFIALLLLSFTMIRFTSKTVSKMLEDISGNLRAAIIDRTRKIGLAFFEKIGAGRIYTSLTSDMKTLAESSAMFIASIEYNIRIVFMAVLFAFLSFPVFLAGMCVAGVTGIFFIYNQLKIKDSIEKLSKGEIEFFGAMTHMLLGFKELRLHDGKNDSFFHTHFKIISSRVSALRLEAAKYMMLNTMLVYGTWTTLMAILPLAYPIIGISEHTLFMCVAIISFLPINALVLLVPPVTLGIESVKRMKELIKILDEAEQDMVPEVPEKEKKEFLELACQDLIFRYPDLNSDDQFFTGPMNLSFSAGELIYITGGNGSGKSTLIKLITGLYTPASGQILLNGHPADIRCHRYLFSVIFSDFHLFDRLYGIPNVDEMHVKELLSTMQLDNRVEYADGKFSTTKLSTGQRKRLALVMAMMENRQVYIFDEWAAEQDPYFRRYFYETLVPGFKADGKTVIAVTHHDQYFHLADRVVRMEYGQVKE